MLAISVRQPWAHFIVCGFKDIENRTWSTKVRGRVLIHASGARTRSEWAQAMEFAQTRCAVSRETLASADFDLIRRGGIIGSVEIVDCVVNPDSPWYLGKYGFVLRNPKVEPFTPYRGRLGFFEVGEWEKSAKM